MWLNLVGNFLLGFAISAAPGAVLVEAIRRALLDRQSVPHFLIGNFLGMTLIVVAVFSGLAGVINDKSTANIFYGICGLLLVYLGIVAIVAKHHDAVKKTRKRMPKSKYTAFSTGLTLALANPLSIIFWIALIGKIIQETNDASMAVVGSASALAGSFIFFAVLLAVIHILHIKISAKNLTVMSRVFGVVLLVYGFVTLGKIVY